MASRTIIKDGKIIRPDENQKEQGQSWLNLSLIPNAFWGALNFVGTFFSTMISTEAQDNYRGGAPRSNNSGGGGYGGNIRPVSSTTFFSLNIVLIAFS